MTPYAIRGRMATAAGALSADKGAGAINHRPEAHVAIPSCRHPGCDQPSIGSCTNCEAPFCSRHIWKADYGAVVAMCYRCHEQVAAVERARTRERSEEHT